MKISYSFMPLFCGIVFILTLLSFHLTMEYCEAHNISTIYGTCIGIFVYTLLISLLLQLFKPFD